MKRTFFPVVFLFIFSLSAFAQKQSAPPAAKEQTQNIIIRKKGGDKEKTTIVIDGDKITVNGKPLKDYKGDIHITENDDINFALAKPLPPMPPAFPHGGAKNFTSRFSISQNSAFLGVFSENDEAGAKINSVTKDSPAEKAGLKTGDIITKIGDDKIEDSDDLVSAIGDHEPADKVSVTYLRDKKENTVTVILDKNKQQSFAWSSGDSKNFINSFGDFSGDWNKPRMGMRVQDVETGSGVKVTDIDDDDSPAAKAGLKEDDIITQIGSKPVSSVKDAKDILADVKPGDNVVVNYQRNGSSQTATVHLPKPLQTSDL